VDAFRVLHPADRCFSWHRRGAQTTRLDRIYLRRVWPPPPWWPDIL
jgi:hypothetical protein